MKKRQLLFPVLAAVLLPAAQAGAQQAPVPCQVVEFSEVPVFTGCGSGIANRIGAAQLQNLAAETSNSVLDMYLGFGGPAATADFGVFSDGRFSHTAHDGYRVEITDPALGPIPDSFTPEFTADQFSVIGSMQGDVSRHLGFSETVARVGVFGGYASNKVNVDPDNSDPFNPVPETSSFNKSGVGGLYVLAAQGPYYGLLTASGIIGSTSVDDYSTFFNAPFEGEYDTIGGVLNGTAGRVFQLDPKLSLDIRSALSLAGFRGDGYVNSLGENVEGVTHVTFAGNLSAGLIGNLQSGDMLLRPYLRAGITHRLIDDNRTDSIAVFKSAGDTLLTGSLGLFVAVSPTVELNGEVSGSVSEDSETIAGKLAVKIQLN